MTAPEGSAALPVAGLWRRLLAMFYDSLLLLSVLLAVTGLVMLLTGLQDIGRNPLYRTLLFVICYLFYSWFWLHGGQTLGMKTWRLRVQRRDGRPITLWHTLARFMAAIPSLALGGIGFFWMLVDRAHLTWYDRFSQTVVVVLPKQR